MATRQQVWTAADHMRGESKRVSLRSVRAELPRGGSYRDIGEHLASWKAERNYQLKIELAQLPEFLQSNLATFGKALWEAAMQEATRQFHADRERFEEILKDERALTEPALMTADLLEERIAKLSAENRKLSLEHEFVDQECKLFGSGARWDVQLARKSGRQDAFRFGPGFGLPSPHAPHHGRSLNLAFFDMQDYIDSVGD